MGLEAFLLLFLVCFKLDFYQHAENPAFKCDGKEKGVSSLNCWCSKEEAVHFIFLDVNFFKFINDYLLELEKKREYYDLMSTK